MWGPKWERVVDMICEGAEGSRRSAWILRAELELGRDWIWSIRLLMPASLLGEVYVATTLAPRLANS